MKIDAEGMEYKILCGAATTINKYHPLIIAEGETLEVNNFFCRKLLQKSGIF